MDSADAWPLQSWLRHDASRAQGSCGELGLFQPAARPRCVRSAGLSAAQLSTVTCTATDSDSPPPPLSRVPEVGAASR